jgi:hypothetical protein
LGKVMVTTSRVGRGVGVNPCGKPPGARIVVATGVGGKVGVAVGRGPGPAQGVGVAVAVAVGVPATATSDSAKESGVVRK